MIRDLAEATPETGQRADVCIVGAGAAGIVLAVELARLGKRVTLLEGGGRLVEETSQTPYLGETPSLPHRGLHGGRVRALGGTTNLWGGQILELDPLDFKQRSWVPESGWPFPKSELAPYYARALELEGVAGALREDTQVWSKVGATRPEFDHLESYVSRWCPEPNFARLHHAELEENARITVWLHANAVELLLEEEKTRGVRVKTLNGIEATFVADRYVFCLGAIESSRFFLQPRAGGLPWNESGLLGKHFQDHIDCNAATVEPASPSGFHRLFDTIFIGGYKYNPKLRLDPKTQQELGLLHAGATFYSVGDMDEVVAEMKGTAKKLLRGRLGQVRATEIRQLAQHAPTLLRHSYRYAVEHRAYHAPGAELRMRVHCEQEPASASSITLTDDRDSLGLLRTRLSWTISELELRTIRGFVEVAQQSLAGVARLIPDADLMEARFIERCEDSYHHMGGMRMDTAAGPGIVDANLKLHGTANTYICSTAVYPTSGFSNPTHTLLALTVRLAERLAR